MMGNPFGPGGYGAVFLRIRDAKNMSNVTGIMNISVARNGSSAVLASRSKSMCVDDLGGNE